MKVTVTLENGQVLQGELTEVDVFKGVVAGAPHADITVPWGGTAGKLFADTVTVTVPDVPQARELVISVAGGDTEYFISVKDPDGNGCDALILVPGEGYRTNGPLGRAGPFANAGQVVVAITKPGAYTADVELTHCSGTGQETVEAHVN